MKVEVLDIIDNNKAVNNNSASATASAKSSKKAAGGAGGVRSNADTSGDLVELGSTIKSAFENVGQPPRIPLLMYHMYRCL